MVRWQLLGFLILWTISACLGKTLYARMESIICPDGDEETLFTCSARLVGRERMINGTITHLVDLDDNYEVWLNILQFKNGEWVQGNINLHLNSCDWFTKYYGKYFLSMITDTNIPPADELCPFPKGEYYVRNVNVAPQNWPSLLYRGLNQLHINYMKDGKSYGRYQIVFDLSEQDR
ncbi:uncharacterized protein CheA29a [Drosophila takahashii]|uniref:uncharacterized protein CheA29a n=1 Tax=Drosophila takahashii TaxID=29030 RepID=UPI001CF7F8F5|nr:uncharacterized protein LOC108062607 [Drosophila takahashii]